MGKKLRIGWFTFTCCEDSSIIFVEMMNQHYFEWKKLLDFRHCKMLKSKNVLDELDVAFVEGAISSDRDKLKLLEIRGKTKYLVAIGSCACTGGISAQRNTFPEHLKAKIEPVLRKWDLYRDVLRLDQVVTVDDRVDGCPMMEQKFLQVLDKYLVEFGVKKAGAGLPGEKSG
jgi:sulfhydrogenase subunit delta